MLTQYGKLIREKQESGCETSNKIIEQYTLLVKSFDPITCIIVEQKLNEFINKYQL